VRWKKVLGVASLRSRARHERRRWESASRGSAHFSPLRLRCALRAPLVCQLQRHANREADGSGE
jgi:hypothetical protein